MFRMMSGMQKTNDWNQTDRAYWEKQGWREQSRFEYIARKLKAPPEWTEPIKTDIEKKEPPVVG